MIKFTKSDIRKYCGEKSYEKGSKCLSFIRACIQDQALFGLYAGTVGVYRVNIICDKTTITYAWCTCPAMSQYDNACKHIAGLMILWNTEPHEFVHLDSWQTLLASMDRDALTKLIIDAATKSIDVTNVFYETLKGEPLFESEELYDYSEW